MTHSARLPALEDLVVTDDRRSLGPDNMVREDRRLGESVGAGECPPTYRIWENARALVITAKDARLPFAKRATDDAASRGCGGRARLDGRIVAHRRGVAARRIEG